MAQATGDERRGGWGDAVDAKLNYREKVSNGDRKSKEKKNRSANGNMCEVCAKDEICCEERETSCQNREAFSFPKLFAQTSLYFFVISSLYLFILLFPSPADTIFLSFGFE